MKDYLCEIVADAVVLAVDTEQPHLGYILGAFSGLVVHNSG